MRAERPTAQYAMLSIKSRNRRPVTCTAPDQPKHLFDTRCMGEPVHRQPGWSPGQRILNHAGAREPEHRLDPPVPVAARIVWEDDGEEYIDTEAAGWRGQLIYVRVPDRRYRLTSVWLAAADINRRDERW
jgi:hypothetical protein